MIAIMRQPLFAVFVNARRKVLSAGQSLFLTGQAVAYVFLVDSGRVQLRRHTPQGLMLVLQSATANTVLAEASVYSQRYHCDAVATEETVVAALSKGQFKAALADNIVVAEAWAAMLACSVQAARMSAEIRSLPKVADRLEAWLGDDNELPGKGRLQDVATELSVTREALYRELSRRRRTSVPTSKRS